MGDAEPVVGWKLKGPDSGIDIPPRLRHDDDARHSDELVEGGSFAAPRLSQSLLNALPSSRDRFQDLRNPCGIRVGLIQGTEQERSSQRSLLEMGLGSEESELLRVLLV